MALKDNLILSLELAEPSGNAVDSHGSNHMAETSGTIDAFPGGGRDLEAADTEYFEIASNADVVTGDVDFAFEIWANLESGGTSPTIFGKWNQTVVADQDYVLYLTTGRVPRFGVQNTPTGGYQEANSGVALTIGAWAQIFCWHDSVNNLIAISVNNGTPVTTARATGVKASATALRLGNNVNNSVYFDGALRRFRMWKGRIPTSGERTSLYNGGAGLAYSAFDGGGASNIPVIMNHLKQQGIA